MRLDRKTKLGLCLIFLSASLFAQENPTFGIDKIELEITGSALNFSFPAIEVGIAVPFYTDGEHSVAFKGTLATYIRGNANYAPDLASFGGFFQLQYRLNTKRGFLFSIETGLGALGEFFTNPVFVDGAYEQGLGVAHGLITGALNFGYDFTPKYNVPCALSLFLGFRTKFPYSISFSESNFVGIRFSYLIDIKKEELD